MKFKIIWSQFAENELDKIFEYYTQKVNIRIAKKIIKEIISEPNKLLKETFISQVEDLLLDRENKYRYLTCNNYKIIYYIDEEKK